MLADWWCHCLDCFSGLLSTAPSCASRDYRTVYVTASWSALKLCDVMMASPHGDINFNTLMPTAFPKIRSCVYLECFHKLLLYTTKLLGGVYWFHSVRPSIPHPSRVPCPLCSFYSSGWIHFIFMHLIKQLQKVCRMQSFLQNFKIWNFGSFLKICYFDFVLFWLGIWCESLVWVIMGRRGVSQNAGVLVMNRNMHKRNTVSNSNFMWWNLTKLHRNDVWIIVLPEIGTSIFCMIQIMFLHKFI